MAEEITMSKIIPKFNGLVKDGKLILDRRQIFDLYIGNFEGCNVDVIVQKKKKSRSLKINALYWVYLTLLESETGEDKENLHLFFKSTLLPSETITVFGREFIVPRSTTELSSAEFSEYMDKIERLTGINVPDPNEYYSGN